MTDTWDRATAPPLALALIAKLEAFRPVAYRDSVGHWTIGYGSTVIPDGQPVRAGLTLLEPAARALLGQQALTWCRALAKAVPGPLTTGQAAALLSFIHNLGPGVLSDCTMIAMLNAGRADLAAAQMGGWVMAGGQMALGLMRRRELERRVMLGADLSCYDSVWRLQMADLLPAYRQAFTDAAAWHRGVEPAAVRAVTAPAVSHVAPVESETDRLNDAEAARHQ